MIILRTKLYSSLPAILEGGIGGTILSALTFAIPVGIITKVCGGKFKYGFGASVLAGAIIGAIRGYDFYSSRKEQQKMDEWKLCHYEEIKNIVNRNLPPKLNNLREFGKQVKILNDEAENCGYEVSISGTVDELISAVTPTLYKQYKNEDHLPKTFPLPILMIWSDIDLKGNSYILWYSKESGWINMGARSISGPKEFVLDCINHRIDTFEVSDEAWFPQYKEDFLKLVNKYLW